MMFVDMQSIVEVDGHQKERNPKYRCDRSVELEIAGELLVNDRVDQRRVALAYRADGQEASPGQFHRPARVTAVLR